MNKVALWARLNDLMPPDKVRDNLSGSLAPRPVHVFGRGQSVRSGSSVNPSRRLTPVVKLFFGGGRSQPRALPFDKMSVLERNLRQFGRHPS